MRCAVLISGPDPRPVLQVIEAEEGYEIEGYDLVPAERVEQGWMHEGGGVFSPPAPPPPTAADVIAERARRLALGFDYDFGDVRGVHRIGTTKADMDGWDEVTTIANALHQLGITTPIGISTDTGPTLVAPMEWFVILVAAADFRQPIWQASFTLQAQNPIPADFAADHHWQA